MELALGGREQRNCDGGEQGTYSNAVSEAGAGLGTSSANVVAHAGVLAGGAVQVSHWPGAAGSRKCSRPGRVGACRRSGRANSDVSRVASQDCWCVV